VIASDFSRRGFVFKDSPKACHTLIINTCGFIDKAKEESLEVIREAIDLKDKNKVKRIIVVGCLSQRYKDKLSKHFPQIDAWQGVLEFSSSVKPKKLKKPYRDFLKISEGCLNKCSFCAIPLIKGPLKSRSLDQIIKEVKYLDQKGLKELNLIGQDITSWGKDFKNRKDLTFLIKTILKETTKIKWIRLIYAHPRHFSDSLINLIAQEPRICKYIDLPIQHINDRILKLMNRGISKKEIITLIKKIRKKIPDCAIRTSAIVGFPTEGDKDFEELLNFLKDIKFERLGAFIYSREEDTAAYNFLDQVHPGTKNKRFKELMSQQQKQAQGLNARFIGKELEVLIESKVNGLYIGRTQYDAPEVDGVVFVKKRNLKVGEFYRVKIIDAYDYDLVAQ
jgi:ribosomal protein S12 methylthiotransferase